MTITKTIVDILPDSATDSHKFLVNNGYKLLEVEEPMIDGEFRDLTDDELLPILADEANTVYTQAVVGLTAGIPDKEILTWSVQKEEAKAWSLDNSVDTPFIDGILSTRTKYSKAELVAKILEKSAAYAKVVGSLTGIRQNQEDQLEGK